MKRPSEGASLRAHYKQAFGYWAESGSAEHEPPPYIVLCSFGRLEVWKPGYPDPHAVLDLEELPGRPAVLGFLGALEPEFDADRAELTREVVELVTGLFGRLEERKADSPDTLRDFILQCVWCMFAEDLRLLPDRMFTKILVGLIRDPSRASEDDLGRLFELVNTPGDRPRHGLYKDAPFVNGQLFEQPAAVHLTTEEVATLREATAFDWHLVEPAIFGFVLEGALGRERQWRFGAHYTQEKDIMKVVGPTVVEPWLARLEACETLEDVQAAQSALTSFHVLDPACGSGNFLYVAYQELRRIELRLHDLEQRLRAERGLESTPARPLFTLQNLHGIEREPFAVRLARVTLWMGHALAVRELELRDEPVLPLEPLTGIWLADALKVEWPPADAIVGNPPYHGSQQLRGELGDEYATFLGEEFGIGLKDYAVYWFRKAHQRLAPDGRAGFVATNSISQNRNRGPTLEWIAENGGVIVNAVSKQAWPGTAVVNVSIVNWVKEPAEAPTRFVLDDVVVDGITPSLRLAGDDIGEARSLPQNRGRSFQGPVAVGAGFVLSQAEATLLLADPKNRDVIRPWLTAQDIAESPRQEASRYIIDFALRRLEEAMPYEEPLKIVRERVKPLRDRTARLIRRRN